jgi:hypothetical protein
MSHFRQVAVGTVATGIVIAFSLVFISPFSFPMFTGWVSYFLLCLVPIEIVASVTWGTQRPQFLGSLPQPAKGLAFILLCLVVGMIVAPLQFAFAGGRIAPPTPMLMMCTIVSVIVVFWLAIMWGGWPFTKMITNPVTRGLVMLFVAYVLNYVLFRIVFSYDFMKDARAYVPSLDPHGLFNAWNAMVFSLTALTVMFLSLNFELWPFTSSRVVMQQPILGTVWTIMAFAVGGPAFYIGVRLLQMDPAAFMIAVPVPFIFGTIVILNMMRGSLFGTIKQPLKGVLNTIAAAVLGTLLASGYRAIAPYVTGVLKPGPPSYELEIWLASALLGVTFPFLIFYAEFLKMWPLHRQMEKPLHPVPDETKAA